MQLTLKAARRLEDSIGNKIRDISTSNKVSTSLHISIYDDVSVKDKVDEKIKEVTDTISDITNLSIIRAGIRREIEKANEKFGVNVLLNEGAFLVSIMQALQSITRYSEVDPLTDAKIKTYQAKKSAKMTGENTSKYDISDTVNINNAFTEEAANKLSGQLANVKKQINEINDKCSFINQSKTIDVDTVDEELLKKYQLI